jgi:hypothetical protein
MTLPQPELISTKNRELGFITFLGTAVAGSAPCFGIALLTWNQVYSTYAYLQPEFFWLTYIIFAAVEACLMMEVMYGCVVNANGLFMSLFTVLSVLRGIWYS